MYNGQLLFVSKDVLCFEKKTLQRLIHSFSLKTKKERKKSELLFLIVCVLVSMMSNVVDTSIFPE